MSTVITFGDIEVENSKFHCYKNPIFLNDANIYNILVSYKVFSGKRNYKYFIGCLGENESRHSV